MLVTVCNCFFLCGWIKKVTELSQTKCSKFRLLKRSDYILFGDCEGRKVKLRTIKTKMNAIVALESMARLQEERDPPHAVRRKIYGIRLNQFVLRDLDFIRRYRFNKSTIREIITLVEEDLLVDVRGAGIPPELQVLVAIRCWGRREVQDDAGELHGISQPSVSRICARVARAIATKAPLFIKMPATLQEEEIMMAKFQAIKNFPGVIGAIDCTHIKIRKTGGEQAQYYINRKGQYSLNVQVVCDADLKILDIVARWRGSTHDSRIFNESSLKQRFDDGQFRGRLLGDSGYPLLPYLFTPVLNPRCAREERYNEAQIGTRNTIERCFGVWKQRFQCLLVGLPVKFHNCKPVIVALAVLHNIAVDMNDTGILPDDESSEEGPAQPHSPNQARINDVVQPNISRRRSQLILQNFIEHNF